MGTILKHPGFSSFDDDMFGFKSIPEQIESFRNAVVEVYDLLMGEGIEQNEAIRKTRAILRANNYPFTTYDIVITRLRAAGRLKRHVVAQAVNIL